MNQTYRYTYLASYIESHGFRTITHADGSVSFDVPFSRDGKHAGYDTHTVRNYGEAREALGY